MKNLIRSFLIVVLIANQYVVHAQVLITPQLPPVGITVKSELWNLSLVNSFPQSLEIQLEVQMTDVSNSQRVFSAISRPFILPKGTKNIRASDIMPLTFNVLNSSYNIDASPFGFLPIGIFKVCYTVIRFDSHAIDNVSEECETVEVEPMAPPTLTLPEDDKMVETSRPFFSWIPPSPVTQFTNLYYDWILVEVLPSQSAMHAVQLNMPVLSKHNLPSLSFQYPLSMAELDTAKTYAWQIKAYNNGAPISNSEAWTFRVKPDTRTSPKIGKVSYSKLSKEQHEVFTVCYGQLGFEYNNEVNDSVIRVELVDITGAKGRKVDLDPSEISVSYGINYKLIDLRENKQVLNKHVYLLKVTNAINENWFIKFEYRESE